MREIVRYTYVTWGIDQAQRYSDELLKCFQTIAHSPSIGRSCNQLRKGYRRMEHGRHVVFYRVARAGVVIVRILHQRMLPDPKRFETS